MTLGERLARGDEAAPTECHGTLSPLGEEIADRSAISLGTVKGRAVRGLRRLGEFW